MPSVIHEMPMSKDDDSYARTIHIPMPVSVLKELQLGEETELTLIGKVTALSDKMDEYDRSEVRLELTAVKIKDSADENVFSELAEDD